MPTSLNCPSCGAPSKPDATQCIYCGARLAMVACPACMGSMLVGSQFCPHCGAKSVDPTAASGAVLHCPGCDGDMPAVQVGTTTMHQCAKCGSSWLSPDAFFALCADKDARGQIAVATGCIPGTATIAQPSKVRYVNCPECHKVMNRVNFAHSSGIIIDVCKKHGVWFEKDELHGVLDFVAKGGMQQQRQHDDAQRALEQHALGFSDPGLLAGTHGTTLSSFTIHVDSSNAPAAPLRALLDAIFH
ncbi:MAG TPA: zinc ribbon domain-containing protein [Gemmatimonadaceae bacterium]|nr:zinc ribbon domain-containing protein [Gemmatimonadaceae bacterium]